MPSTVTIIPVIFRPAEQLGRALDAAAQVQILTRNVTDELYMTCLSEANHMVSSLYSDSQNVDLWTNLTKSVINFTYG